MRILADLRSPIPGPWGTTSGLVWEEGEGGWNGNSFYQVPPGLLQLPELHFELRLCYFGGSSHGLDQMGNWSGSDTYTEMSSPGVTQKGRGRWEMGYFAVLASEAQRAFNRIQRVSYWWFVFPSIFTSYNQCQTLQNKIKTSPKARLCE